jgi:hypothetical protein
MKKRLIATLCSAVIALSSLTGITAQAAQSWRGYTDVRIYDKSFSGTQLSAWGGFKKANISFDFTVTQSELPVVNEGYTTIKVTSKKVANETIEAYSSGGYTLTRFTTGETYETTNIIYDSFGNRMNNVVWNTFNLYSYTGTNGYVTWNAVKCLLEPYGYTYEYINALASQTYTEIEYYNKDLSVEHCMLKRELEIINSALCNIYNNSSSSSSSQITAYQTTLGNYMYEVKLDAYNYIYIIPNSEKFYFEFNDTCSKSINTASTDTLYCITLN